MVEGEGGGGGATRGSINYGGRAYLGVRALFCGKSGSSSEVGVLGEGYPCRGCARINRQRLLVQRNQSHARLFCCCGVTIIVTLCDRASGRALSTSCSVRVLSMRART